MAELTGDGLRSDISEMLAKAGIKTVANVATACMNQRAHIVGDKHEADYWFKRIQIASDHAMKGANCATIPQIALLPHMKQPEVETCNAAGHYRSGPVTIIRVDFLIGFPDRKWTGKKMTGISPTNAELADPANWECHAAAIFILAKRQRRWEHGM